MRAQRRRTLTSEGSAVPVASDADLCNNEADEIVAAKPKPAPKRRAKGVKTNAKKNG